MEHVTAVVAVTTVGLVVLTAYAVIRVRNMHIWLPRYAWRRLAHRRRPVEGVRHVLFCFVDHFEPEWRRPPVEVSLARVRRWLEDYPKLARRHADGDGRMPVHSFFFPEEEYKPEYLDMLAQLCRDGFGEIDVHLHHDDDTPDGFRAKLNAFSRRLRDHDCLACDAEGNDRFAFIHGNWCLDNSRPDGRYCGVNDEIRVLAECGCYADFTLPAAPNPAQTRESNSIYYAVDDPHRPKSHDTGTPLVAGRRGRGDLMIIQGVLALNWRRRKLGILPRIENSEVSASNWPTAERIDMWINRGVTIAGRPEWLFVKVHAHGAGEADAGAILGAAGESMFAHLERHYNDGVRYRLHYVSAREMYNIARAAEDGHAGNPDAWRDYEIRRAAFGVRRAAQAAVPEGGVG